MASNAVIGSLRVDLGLDSANFSAGLKKAQTSLSGLERAMASVSTSLKSSFGGFVAGAASAVTLGAAINGAKDALDAFGNIADKAAQAGLGTDLFQGVATFASQSGVAIDEVSSALNTFAKNSGLAAVGKGKLVSTLQKLNPELLRNLQLTSDQEERMRLAADAIAAAGSASERAALSTALFGDAGAKMAVVFQGGAAALDDWMNKARDMGLIVDRDIIAKADAMGDSFDIAAQVLDTQLKQAFVNLAPIMIDAARFAGDVANAINRVIDSTRELGAKSREGLERDRTDLMQLLGNVQSSSDMNQNPMGVSMPAAQVQEMKDQLAEIDAELRRRALDDLRVRLAELPKQVEDTAATIAATDAVASRLESLRMSLMTEEQIEVDSHAKRLAELQKFYADGLIKKTEYDDLVQAAQRDHADKMVDIARKQADKEAAVRYALADASASIFGSLATIAENAGERGLAAAKGFAVAQAIVSTAAGIMKAFEQTGVLGWVSAAAIAATGAAQISTILSTQKGSGTKPSVSGGGTSTAAVAVPTAAPEMGRAINITFQGIGRAGMEQFVRELNDALGDGVKLNLT